MNETDCVLFAGNSPHRVDQWPTSLCPPAMGMGPRAECSPHRGKSPARGQGGDSGKNQLRQQEGSWQNEGAPPVYLQAQEGEGISICLANATGQRWGL